MRLRLDHREENRVVVKVAARELVVHCHKSGDLFHHQFGSVTAQEGILGHQRLQRSRPEDYQSEVRVTHVHAYDRFDLEIRGRIDGVFPNANPVVIEEIKTTRRAFEDIEPHARELHLAQGKLYAWLYAFEHKLDSVDVRRTYLHVDSLKIDSEQFSFTREALDHFFEEVTRRYMEWAARIYHWRRERDQSLDQLPFPFETYRSGQRRFAAEVYRSLRDGKRLYAQAPTGIGKTAGSLFPACKALAEGRFDRLFFLTAKTSGAFVAEKALALMRQQGMALKSSMITARDKMCIDAPCDLETCPYAIGYYDRLQPALADLFAEQHLDRETIRRFAEKHTLCPFELALDAAVFSDAVICDYNYAFDPAVTLRRFFGEDGGCNALLVDEAHNLVDRSRAMYSAELDKTTCHVLYHSLKLELPDIAKRLNSLNRWFNKQRKQLSERGLENQVLDEVPTKLIGILHRFCKAVDDWRNEEKPSSFPPDLLDFYLLVRQFMRAADYFDERFAAIIHMEDRKLVVKIRCLDASALLKAKLDRNAAAVFFSATLTPFTYFSRLLGGQEDSGLLALASPFPPENLCLLAVDRLSTRYKHRQSSLEELVAVIAEVVGRGGGNYLVFFPSYKYMAQVVERFEMQHQTVPTLVQQPGMSDEARADFLERFRQEQADTLVGFAVMGGIFAEGIDLVGRALVGVVVVGVGLPRVELERDLIMNHFKAAGEPGYAFAYQFPGMNRVLQTAGRVIRTETDRGVVCLIDDRFSQARYRELYPPHWQPIFVSDGHQLRTALDGFWSSPGSDVT